MKKKVHQDVIIGIVTLLICAAWWLATLKLVEESATLPRMALGLMALLSVGIIVQGIKKTKAARANNEECKKLISFDDIKIPFLFFLFIAGYALLFYLIGYFASTIIFLVAAMLFLKQKNWKTIVFVTLGFVVFTYVLFVRILGVNIMNFGLLSRIF